MNPILQQFSSQTLTIYLTLISVWIAMLGAGYDAKLSTAVIVSAILGWSIKQGLKEFGTGKSASA